MHDRSVLRWAILLAVSAAGVLVSPPASAEAPALRWQRTLRGDVRLFGSTLATDCHSHSVQMPSCIGVLNADDTAPDLYFRDSIAGKTVLPGDARTSVTLSLPPGATVAHARLYWAAVKIGAADDSVVIDSQGTEPPRPVTADACVVAPHPYPASHPDWHMYQCSSDVTNQLSSWTGPFFRVAGVDAVSLGDTEEDVTFSAWTLVVVYESSNETVRNLAIFDGLQYVDPPSQGAMDQTSVQVTGLLVPPGFDAKAGIFAYDGDFEYAGDSLSVNGSTIENAENPASNFFNSSRTVLGAPASGTFDSPSLTGAADTMGGYDLDLVDVTGFLNPGDTHASVSAGSTYDKLYVGGIVTSVTTLAPSFHDLAKTVTDDNGGSVLTGDILTYEVSGSNEGSDTAVGVTITDELDPGLEYVSGSLQVLTGGVAGYKTDPALDDEADFNPATRTITWRLGAGADSAVGGKVPPGGSIKVSYKAKVSAQQGTVANRAEASAFGQSGADEATWSSDDPNKPGRQSTDVEVAQCETNAQCAGVMPHCNTVTHVCEGCTSDSECQDPAKPACLPNGNCAECSKANAQICASPKPECDEALGACVFCVPGSNPAPACIGSPDGSACIFLNDKLFCGCATDQDCGGPECLGNSYNARVCKYAGWCQTNATGTDCTPYKCSSNGCGTSCSTDADCADQHYCDGAACSPRKAAAEPCSAAAECTTGFCVDGVCCGSPCTGQCEACDGAGKEGVCSAVEGAPHGIRPSCAGNGACEGACDGTSTASCEYPGATVSCETICSSGKPTVSACDGTGKCAPATTKDCAPYACDEPGTCVGQQDAGSEATAESAETGGCGCSTPTRGRSGTGVALGLLALARVIRRRRGSLRASVRSSK